MSRGQELFSSYHPSSHQNTAVFKIEFKSSCFHTKYNHRRLRRINKKERKHRATDLLPLILARDVLTNPLPYPLKCHPHFSAKYANEGKPFAVTKASLQQSRDKNSSKSAWRTFSWVKLEILRCRDAELCLNLNEARTTNRKAKHMLTESFSSSSSTTAIGFKTNRYWKKRGKNCPKMVLWLVK